VESTSQAHEEFLFSQLLAAARAGDGEALGKLLDPFRRILRRRAAKRLQPVLQAKQWPSDVVQDTYLAAVQGFPEFRGQTEKQLYAWLRTILERETSNCERYYLKEKRRVTREVHVDQWSRSVDLLNALLANTASPVADAMRGEVSQDLQGAIEDLPELYREVVRMHVWSNMSFSMISRRLGQSPEAVRKYWMRARRHLAIALKNNRQSI